MNILRKLWEVYVAFLKSAKNKSYGFATGISGKTSDIS